MSVFPLESESQGCDDDDFEANIGLVFDESLSFDDPIPCRNWVPTPQQIRRWAQAIREENLRQMLEEHKSRHQTSVRSSDELTE